YFLNFFRKYPLSSAYLLILLFNKIVNPCTLFVMTIAFDGQNNGQMTTPYPSNPHKYWIF
ncbi:MAG: hypothetical protein J6K43_09415, partial [Lachnospiraceae bacterium]|nr:hypothetical protein [Lachnospiraceae bacterium]